jgi:hypothetical protein
MRKQTKVPAVYKAVLLSFGHVGSEDSIQTILSSGMWTGNMAAVETSEGTADGTCARRRLNRALWVEEMALWDII